MKKISFLIITLAMILVFATTAWGVSFGARATGMGGAFTAVADDGSAAYWNPAGITQLNILAITPNAGRHGDFQAFTDLMNSDTNIPDYPDELALDISGYLGFTAKFLGVNLFFDAGTTITKDSTLYNRFDELHGYIMGTIAIPFDSLAIGGNIKFAFSQYSKEVQPLAAFGDILPGNTDLLSDPEKNYMTSAYGMGLAIDAGVLLSVTDRFKIGFAARNLYSKVNWTGVTYRYSYDPDTGSYWLNEDPENFEETGPLPSSYSLGIALRPTDSTLIAADAEMMIHPIHPDLNVTLYHVGLEQLFLEKILALRLGAYTTPTEEIGYSLGIGLKLGPLLVDVALTKVGEAPGEYVTAGFKF